MEPLPSTSLVGGVDPSRRGNRFLLLALVATLVLWNVPYGWILIYPFKLFATWLHELSHGLLMLAMGGGLDRLEIFPDTSGMAMPRHGVSAFAQAVISCAGYMGTATWGALFLVLGRSARGARLVLAALSAVLTLSALLWIRNAFGFAAILVLAGCLLGVARFGSEAILSFLLNFLATQSCILAVLDIRTLFADNLYVNGQPYALSDANLAAKVVGGPYWLWASAWLVWSFALFYLALRYVRLRPTR